MNIFFLSLDLEECARFHCDAHCVKMILEACQMLWTAFHFTGINNWKKDVPSDIKIYSATHKNHPTAIWVRSSRENFCWTAELAWELCREYTVRYGKIHACQGMVEWFLNNTPLCNECINTKAVYPSKSIPPGCTPPPLAMPVKYHDEDLVTAYRDYYRGDKRRFAKWKYTNVPKWF